MIRLFYSNALETLVDALCDRADSHKTDWTEPTHVIVPNRNLATFLKLQIARHRGVAFDIQTTYLYAFFKSLLPTDYKLTDRLTLQSAIIDALLDPVFMAGQEMTAARRYVYNGDIADEVRAVQLSSQVARLFDEYALSRQSLVARWPTGPQIDEPVFAETERWQRRLWLELFGDDGRLTALPNLLPLQSADRFFGESSLPSQIHVFGLSYVALAFYKLFDQLAAHTDVSIYTLNPCMEYWEDVPKGWPVSQRKTFIRRTQEQSLLMFGEIDDFGSDDPPALRAWGRPGRDHIHLLNMLTACDFESRFYDPLDDGTTILHQLQHDVLVRKPVHETRYDMSPDGSIRILEAPNIHREVEAIADEIWRLIEQSQQNGTPLGYQDIAVIVNHEEKDRYQSRIRSVFETTHGIPHNVVDINAKSNRRYLEAVDHLLTLPFSNFERRAMLQTITHANVIAKFPRAQRDLWIHWCDQLSVYHGGDASDHEGTYIAPNLYHWDQALKRITLGVFCADAPEPIALADGEYLPQEINGTDLPDAASFVSLVSNLISDVREFQRTRHPLKTWCAITREFLLRYLEASSDEDVISQRWCFEKIAGLEAVDFHERELSYDVFFDMLNGELDALRVSRGYYLTDGVVVSSFLPMRPIPFKIVFIAGMGDRQFPQRDPRSPLDLRWVSKFRPQRGDMVSPKSRDEYMFLETVISTRDKLYLSYVDRDAQTGEPQQPSEVLRQLEYFLERDYVASDGTDHPLREEIPLHRHLSDQHYLPQVPVERDADRMRNAGDELAHRNGVDRLRWRTLAEIFDRQSIEVRDEMLERLGMANAKFVDRPASPSATTISVAQLKRFLWSPLQGSAEFLLNFSDRQTRDMFSHEEESFGLDFGPRAQMLRDIFEEHLQTDDPLETLLDARIARETLKGRFPSGIFSIAEKRVQIATLSHWRDNLERTGADPANLKALRFGEGDRQPLSLGRVDVDIGHDVSVQIIGDTGLVDDKQGIAMPLRTTSYLPEFSETWGIDSFVDLCVAVAGGASMPDQWSIETNLAAPYDRRCQTLFDAPTKDEAIRFLKQIAADMLVELHPHVLPIEAVLLNKSKNVPLEEALDRCLSNTRTRFHWGPVRNLEVFNLPPHPDAVIARRFGLYFTSKRDDT